MAGEMEGEKIAGKMDGVDEDMEREMEDAKKEKEPKRKKHRVDDCKSGSTPLTTESLVALQKSFENTHVLETKDKEKAEGAGEGEGSESKEEEEEEEEEEDNGDSEAVVCELGKKFNESACDECSFCRFFHFR
jgi:hypothetical protein